MIAGDAALRFRLDLREVPLPVWPMGIVADRFGSGDADEVERLLIEVRADGLAGSPLAQHGWFERVRCDAEWDASLVILARLQWDGAIVGVAHSRTGAFLKDLAVAPGERGRGLGAALVHETARRFRERGATRLDLKVNARNEPARRLYGRLGFRLVAG